MVEARLIYAIIIFVSIFFTLTTSAFIETTALAGFVNSTSNENITFITTGNTILDPPACQFTGGDFVADGGILIQCMGDYIGYLFGFIGLQNDSPFVGTIFLAIAVVMLFIAIGLIARIATAIIPF